MNNMGWKLNANQFADLNRALNIYHIDTPARIQNFMAQVSHESGKGRDVLERSDKRHPAG
jgi:predicted chitinase